jgi:hypothetical protein
MDSYYGEAEDVDPAAAEKELQDAAAAQKPPEW